MVDYIHLLAWFAIFVLNWSAERYAAPTLARVIFWATALSPLFLLLYIELTVPTDATNKGELVYRELLIIIVLLYSGWTTFIAWLGRRAARKTHPR